jgi:CheY-like chemotaxis protein
MAKAGVDSEAVKYLETAEHAVSRAVQMVRELMWFSRRGSADERSFVDVAEVLGRAANICRTTFDRKILVDVEASDSLPLGWGSPGQIEQVLLNICLNARDAFQEAKTQAPLIQLGARLEDEADESGAVEERIVVEVRDNGPGLAEDVRARVFEPFFTTTEVGRGTGLGLASAYAIIDDHGGRLYCLSVPGRGTTFRFSLRIHPRAERIERVSRPKTSPPGRELILVIDDEHLVRTTARSILEGNGYRVIEASDGVEGLAKLEQHSGEIALVLLDSSMPHMSGPEFLDAAPGFDIKVILFTGLEDADAEHPRVQSVLRKPVRAACLLERVREVLDDA